MTIGCRCHSYTAFTFLPGLEVRSSENSQYDWQYWRTPFFTHILGYTRVVLCTLILYKRIRVQDIRWVQSYSMPTAESKTHVVYKATVVYSWVQDIRCVQSYSMRTVESKTYVVCKATVVYSWVQDTSCVQSYSLRRAESKQRTGALLNEQLSAILISHVTCIMFYNNQILYLCISGVSVLEDQYKPDTIIRR
jgi:hypothetical protein